MNAKNTTGFFDKLKVYPQHILPQHFLSAIMYRITRIRTSFIKNFIIKLIIRLYRVEMQDAVITKGEDYASFNHFFTRALKAESRPICTAPNTIACPVDGTVSQCGNIDNNLIFQAKGHNYSLQALLGDNVISEAFKNGSFATIYLSPRDYHRIHAPLNGKLKKMIHVPGKLFSVNEATTNHVPGLFARNERVVSIFETEIGPMAVILVGAIFVSSIETVWAGTITPPGGKHIVSQNYDGKTFQLNKGDELGRFNMGSTVILLFPESAANWKQSMTAGSTVQMGEEIGQILPGK